MIEIDGTNLKTYIHSSKSCNVTARGCVLKPKSCHVNLSFEGINVNKCLVRLQRLPGSDGVVIINGSPHTLPLNVIAEIEIKSSMVSVKRNKRPLGNIVLIGVTIDEGPQKQVVNMSCDWSSFVKRSKSVKGIKLTDNGLFASEYAAIDGPPKIRKIETDPPNAYRIKNNFIKFLYPCRIINIEFNDDLIQKTMDSKFVQEVASKIDHKAQYNDNVEDIGPKIDAKDYDGVPKKKGFSCVFNLSNMQVGTLSKASGLRQAGMSVKLNRMGTFEVPISNLMPYQTYTISLNAAKVDGNGKLYVTLGTTAGSIRETKMILVPPMENEMFISMNTGRHPEFNSTYNITVHRPKESATGDILVRCLKVFEVTSTTVKPIKQQGISVTAPITLQGTTPTYEEFDVTKGWYDYDSVNLNRNIRDMSQYFSVLAPEMHNPKNKIQIGAVFKLTDYSSRVWFNRMSPSFVGSEFVYQTTAYHGKKGTSKNDNISLCSIDFLTKSPRMFLDSMPNHRGISKQESAILRRTQIILTPSMIDLYKIRNKMPEQKVELCALPWAYIDDQYKRKDYSVYYEEDEQITLQLLSAWDSKFGRLYIIGSNVVLPPIATHVSSLTPYPQLLRLILEGKRLIYLSSNFHHKSGLIDLAKDAGMIVFSNNHHYVGTSSAIRNDKEAGMPLSADIKRSLIRDLEGKFEFGMDIAAYNSKVVAEMKKIIGVRNA